MSLIVKNTMPAEKNVRRAKKKVRVKVHKKTELEKIGRGINYQGRPKKKTGRKLTPEEKIALHKRQEQAMELRMTGATYQQIADALGYSNPSSAKFAVDACIGRTDREAAKEVVALDLARLDEYQMRCTHALRNNGDLHQIDRLMRIMEMRYRLLGITDETVRAMQSEHGISITNTNNVMHIHAAPETESDFIRKMMLATGVNPDSAEAKNLLREHSTSHDLPMLEGSANEGVENRTGEGSLADEDIVEAEIVEEMDNT